MILRPQFRILNAFFFLIKSIYGLIQNSKLLCKNPFDFTNFSMKKNFICCGTKLFTWFLFLRSHRWLLFFSSLTSLQSYNICIDVNEVRLNIFFSLFLLYTLCPSHSVIWQCSHVFDNWHIHWITNKQLSNDALFLFWPVSPIYLVLYQCFCYFSFFLVHIMFGIEVHVFVRCSDRFTIFDSVYVVALYISNRVAIVLRNFTQFYHALYDKEIWIIWIFWYSLKI